MHRRRRSSTMAALVFITGFVLTAWAASGAASVAGAGVHVVVPLEDDDILELFCNDGVGHKDGFCRADGDHLFLNFDVGLDGLEYGLQPGSRYVFGKVMFIRNIWDEPVDVRVTVEQAAGGELYRVLSVFLEEPGGARHQMFPPASGDANERTVRLDPGGTADLSFGFDVPADWGAFADSETRYTLEGAVIVFIERDDKPGGPGGGGRPPGGDGGDTPVTPPEEEPPSAQPEPEGEGEFELEIEEEPPIAGLPPLPVTGGSTWPYGMAGMFLMAVGAGMYLWSRARQA